MNEATRHTRSVRPSAARRRCLTALGLVALAFFLTCSGAFAFLAGRYAHRESAEAAERGMKLLALDDTSNAEGTFTKRIEYTSLAAPAGQTVSTEITWNDAWFFDDPAVYNHDLATACSVLSALAYSESAHHQSASDTPPYMENALSQLGFDYATTASYEYRSEIVDEVLDAVTQGSDVVAYTVATKEIAAPETGERKLLVLVAIRGSYGSEWLSDFNIYGPVNASESDAEDHSGFQSAAREIVDELALLHDERPDEQLALLFTGHSRGGAAANLLASYVDDEADGSRPLADRDSVYAYTFASPADTTCESAHDARYDNIFNILNPADMVVRFPLASWGYARYGRDVWLPSVDGEGFDELYVGMRESFHADVGAQSGYDPADERAIATLEGELSESVPSPESAATPEGVWTILSGVLGNIDVVRALHAHFPNVYTAWLDATQADDLRFE